MAHRVTADLAESYVAERLSDAEVTRAGRRLAIELRAGRRRTVRARRRRLVPTYVDAAGR